jgi:hypothetical protein
LLLLIPSILRKDKRGPVAVLLHDGAKWHGASFRFEKGDYVCAGTTTAPGSEAKAIPRELTAWAAAKGCERVRVFLPAEVNELDPQLPADASTEEMQTALAFELAPAYKLTPRNLRVAAVRASTYRMGGDPDALLAAGFDARLIERYDSACRAAGIRFEGVGALELATLAWHARRASDHGLMIVEHRSTFVATPPKGRDGAFIRTVPFGTPQQEEDEQEWRERLTERLRHLRDLPVSLLTSHDSPDRIAALVTEALGCETTEVGQLDEVAPLIMRHAAWANVGVVDNGCASVTRARPKPNWRRISSVAAAGLVLLAAVLCVVWEFSLRRQEPGLAKAAQEAQQAAKAERRMREQVAAESRLSSLLHDGQHVEPICLVVLDALPEAVGRATRIVSFRAESDCLVIDGETRDPQELCALRRALDRAVEQSGWRVEEGGIASGASSGMWECTYRVTRGER